MYIKQFSDILQDRNVPGNEWANLVQSLFPRCDQHVLVSLNDKFKTKKNTLGKRACGKMAKC